MTTYPSQVGETSLGPIMKVGPFHATLEVQRTKRAHQLAYRIASVLCDHYQDRGFAVRVLEPTEGNLNVRIEYGTPDDLPGVIRAIQKVVGDCIP